MIEKRKHSRMDVGYEVFITHKGRTSMARSRDISVRGVGLLLSEPVEAGESVDLTIVPPQGMLNISLTGTVCYCRENPGKKDGQHAFLAGIEFSEETRGDIPFMDIQGDVMHYTASHSVSIETDAKECYRLLGEFERYPEWAGVMKSARVLESYPDGRGRKVEFSVDVFLGTVRYILDYSFDDDNLCLSWVSAGGDLLSVTGRYYFKPLGKKETASFYELDASLDLPFPNRVAQYFSRVVMRKTMKEFKAFAEKNARPG